VSGFFFFGEGALGVVVGLCVFGNPGNGANMDVEGVLMLKYSSGRISPTSHSPGLSLSSVTNTHLLPFLWNVHVCPPSNMYMSSSVDGCAPFGLTEIKWSTMLG
jgi:hypothetical protein